MAAKTAALEIRPEAVEQPLSAEELADRRERVDRILRAVMAEPDAGFRAIGVLYQEFAVRCRRERASVWTCRTWLTSAAC